MYQRTVLPNGIRVVTEYLPHLRSVTLGAWFQVGSRYELPDNWGISHFIEHLMFKGNRKYSVQEIAQVMDERGGYLNAFTSKETTCYYFKVLDEHFPVATDVLREMLLHSLFLPSDLVKEKNVVLEELSMYEDSPEELVHDLFSETIWPDNGLGRRILGSPSTIQNFDRNNVLEYMSQHYTSDRLVIASAGNIPHEQVVEFAQSFSQLPRGQNPAFESPQTSIGAGTFVDKDIEQVHLCVGGAAPSVVDERRYALYLLDTIIGGGVSSLLFQELREERGLVYNAYSFNSLYQDTGSYGIYAGFNPQNWSAVWDVIVATFSNLPQLITEEMLKRAKSQLSSGLLLSLESTSNRMMRLARSELELEKVVTPEEFLEQIQQVSYGELVELAAEIYNPQKWSWVGLGPQHLIKEEGLCQKIC